VKGHASRSVNAQLIGVTIGKIAGSKKGKVSPFRGAIRVSSIVGCPESYSKERN